MNGKGKPTIYDISEKLNLSAATVSRALNNSPSISFATKKLIKRTAFEMDYKQNKVALALQSGKTKNVGVIVPFIDRNFFSSVIRGIEERLTPFGYHVIICQTQENPENEIRLINTLLDTQIDGIFISVSKSTTNTCHLENVLLQGTPLIFFDRYKEIPGVSSVTINDFKGSYLATNHLIKQGCKRIVHFSGGGNSEIYVNRYEGYKAALKFNKIAIDNKLVIPVDSTVDAGAEAISTLWENSEEKPDAIFSASDHNALGAIRELIRRKIKIPEEFCVVGFSNEPFTNYVELPISSVDQSSQLMGNIVAEVFLERININNTLTIEKKVVLTPKLVVRESSNRKKILKIKR